jgi:hypothetical protein
MNQEKISILYLSKYGTLLIQNWTIGCEADSQTYCGSQPKNVNNPWYTVFSEYKMTVCWDVALYSLVGVYQRFRGACCLHHQGTDDEGSKHLWNVGKLLPDYQKTVIFIPTAIRTWNLIFTEYFTLFQPFRLGTPSYRIWRFITVIKKQYRYGETTWYITDITILGNW